MFIFNVIIMEFIHLQLQWNTSRNSKINFLMYADLLSVNVTFSLCIATKSYCQIFCVTYSLVWRSILNSLFLLLTLFTSIIYLTFSRFFSYTTFFNNFCNAFPSLLPFFCFYSFLRVELNKWFQP